MRLTPKLVRLMLRAFSGSEVKFLFLLLSTPKAAYRRTPMSLG